MEQQQLFKVRDMRKKEQFVVDDAYLNGYARKVGIYATGVYMSLCRHAQFHTQKAFPSIELMAEELAISIASVKRGINKLEKYNIIIHERKGKMLNNEYILIDKSEWKVIAPTEPSLTQSDSSVSIKVIAPTDQSDSSHRATKDSNRRIQIEGMEMLRISGNEINDLIKLFQPINPSYERIFRNKTQREALSQLIKKHGVDKIRRTIEALPGIISQKYAPRITTPLQLQEKLGELIIFYKQERQKLPTIIDLT